MDLTRLLGKAVYSAAGLSLAIVLFVHSPAAQASASTTTIPGATSSMSPDTEVDQGPTTPADLERLVPGGWFLQPGYVSGEARVACPGKPVEMWGAVQAAAFLESIIPTMFFGNPTLEDPPAGAPVCTVQVKGLNGGNTVTVFGVNYVQVGDKVWVQSPGNKWFVPVERTRLAFENKVKPIHGSLIKDMVVATTTTAPKAVDKADDRGGDDNSNTLPILIGGVVIGAALIGAVVVRQRRSKAKTAADTEGTSEAS